MARQPSVVAILAAACVLALGACSKPTDSGASAPAGTTGTGLHGGIASGSPTAAAPSTPSGITGTSAPMGAGSAPGISGSTNTTRDTAVGTRP